MLNLDELLRLNWTWVNQSWLNCKPVQVPNVLYLFQLLCANPPVSDRWEPCGLRVTRVGVWSNFYYCTLSLWHGKVGHSPGEGWTPPSFCLPIFAWVCQPLALSIAQVWLTIHVSLRPVGPCHLPTRDRYSSEPFLYAGLSVFHKLKPHEISTCRSDDTAGVKLRLVTHTYIGAYSFQSADGYVPQG